MANLKTVFMCTVVEFLIYQARFYLELYALEQEAVALKYKIVYLFHVNFYRSGTFDVILINLCNYVETNIYYMVR